MDKILLNIRAIATSEIQANSFIIILKEENGNRQLPVVIGAFEAQAIAIAIENIPQNRPLTHDLFSNFIKKLGAKISEVIISDLKDGVFHSIIFCKTLEGNTIKIDSRTSDAIALAVRFSCPIYVYPRIMDEAGIVFEAMPEPDRKKGTAVEAVENELSKLSKAKLNDLLEKALENEAYERAAEIRDELKKRALL